MSGSRGEEGTNLWRRLIDVAWDISAGNADYVGGDSLFRVEALKQCGGWPIELIAGEEPDTCFRCADLGWNCWRLPNEMTLHDIRMTRFGEYWKRSVRAGHAYVEVALRRRHGHHGKSVKQTISICVYATVLPVAMIVSGVIWWPLPIVLSLIYVRLGWSITRWSLNRGRPLDLSLLIAALTILGKFAGGIGILKYIRGRLSGTRTRIIEYKQTTDGTATASAESALPNNQ